MIYPKKVQEWQSTFNGWRWRQSNRRRRWATIRYNLLHHFPFIAWPYKLLILVVSLIVFSSLTLAISIEMGAFGKLPERSDLVRITTPMASEVLADNGAVLGRYYFENRSNVQFKDISPAFIEALIATEDARFFYHDGVDLRSWGRVFFKTLLNKDRSSGGGSTLSQQLAKNLYPRESYYDPVLSLVINKLKEVFIARRLELLYSKEEILELYLNTVSFSENTYGIKVAAQRFFNTDPRNLTPEQSAILVAMLKAPSTYNPNRHPELSRHRRNLVLEQMARYGYLSPSAADSLQHEPLCLEYFPLDHDYGPATYFREHLRLEVKELLSGLRKENGMAYNLYTDGLKIYTTLDANLQTYAEASVKAHMADLQKAFEEHLQGADPWEFDTVLTIAKYNSERYRHLAHRQIAPALIDSIFETPVDMTVFSWDGEKKVCISPMDSIRYYLGFLNAGLLAMEPYSGRIKAWVGGIDYEYFKYDHVKSHRQIGSTFKPVVYTTAIQQGIPPCTYTPNTLHRYLQYQGWMPQNATNRYGGLFSMEGGLTNSINTVTVRLAMRARPRNVAALAEALGIAGPVPRVPAIALGAIDASLIEMVTAYGTFANRGLRPEPYYIKRIETPAGKVLLDFEAGRDTCNWVRPLYTEQADIINHMLRAVVDRGTGRRLRWRYQLPNELAGKTGTSQNHSDGWFMGFTPHLVTGVWVGAESPAVHFRNLTLGQGANTALPIFGQFIQKLNADGRYDYYVNAPFPELSDAVRAKLRCPNIIYPEDAPVDSLETKKPIALLPLHIGSQAPRPPAKSDGKVEPVAAKTEDMGNKNDN
jgi:penicillin-binding protein 1A